MNNVIIMGKVISKSKIHFDYKDKLKAYFYLTVIEKNNIFDVVISEKYMTSSDMLAEIYNSIYINNMICIFGNVTNINNNYLIDSEEIYIFT